MNLAEKRAALLRRLHASLDALPDEPEPEPTPEPPPREPDHPDSAVVIKRRNK